MGLNVHKVGANQWFLNVRVRKDGKELRKRETFQGTKPQAEERYIQLKKELRYGAAAAPARKAKTFGDILELYREKRPPSNFQSQGLYDKLLRDLGSIPLSMFSDRLEAYLKILGTTPSAKTGKPLSGGSINRLMQVVNAALNLAVTLSAIEKSPITRAGFQKRREVPRDRVLTPYESLRLLNMLAVEAPHLVPLVRFALQVPCRKSELVNMRLEDLDLFSEPPCIRVHNGTTKNGEGCWKIVPPDMLPYFQSLHSECPYLFHRVENGVYRPLGDFKTAWKRCLRLAGIADFRFHDTRHIAVSGMIDAGTPEQVVMQAAGWKTPMFRTYYHKAGKQSLGLVRFPSGSGHLVDTIEVERAKVC